MANRIFDQSGEVTARPKRMMALWERMDEITIKMKEELRNIQASYKNLYFFDIYEANLVENPANWL